MTLFIILPIYNEAQNLESLLQDIDRYCCGTTRSYHVVAIDDGSSDGSDTVLSALQRKYRMNVITHARNRGLGETTRDGFELAADLANPGDILLRMDADRTHDPKYIPDLIAAINQGADIAIASRFSKGGGQVGIPNNRKLMSWLANFAFRIFFPLGGIREYTCGYRAYKAAIVQAAIKNYGNDFIQLRGLGFSCTVEKLLKLKLIGAKLIEVPFVLRYDLKNSESKMLFNITVFGYLVMVILYHWPRSGWRAGARERVASNDHT